MLSALAGGTGRAPAGEPIKLNLGCGQRLLAGYVNVDKFGEPDLRCDLEQFPWPWTDDSAGEVVMSHVLEHLGASSDSFIRIMQELHRVCRAGALIHVTVPHPRHDTFLADPTHVRPITPLLFTLFSKTLNREWAGQGYAATPLALYHDVDFEVEASTYVLEAEYARHMSEGGHGEAELQRLLRTYNNVAAEISIRLRVIKG
jgi:hypothetical protein